MRTLTLLAAVLVAACCHNPQRPAVAPLYNVWRMELGTGGSGTAWPVGLDARGAIFCTAAHMLHERMAVVSQEGRRLEGGRVYWSHLTEDIALVHFPTDDPPAVIPIRRTMPPLGTPVRLVSYPMRLLYITQGLLSGGRRVSTQAVPGSSGGPILDDQGAVVGILEHMLMMRTNQSRVQMVPHLSHLVPVGLLPPVPGERRSG